MTKTMANVTVKVNQSAIKRDKRNGRDVWVVPSKTMPRDIVMNNIMYSGEEIEKGYRSLERTPAPFGHPKVNGMYVSAFDPEAINISWIGAYNEDVQWDGSRLSVSKVIDVEVANRSEEGRRVLAALEKGEPVSTSTGIFLEAEELDEPRTNARGQEYQVVAKNLIFNHDAVLLDEDPAAGPAQGTGIFVNAQGEKFDVQQVNLHEDDFADMVEFMSWEIVEAAERERERERKRPLVQSVKEKIVSALRTVLSSTSEEADGLAVNSDHEEDVMSEIKREEFDALVSKVDTLVSNAEKAPSVSDQITEALKPVAEQLQANAEAEKAKAKAEHEAAVNKVVEAEILEKEVAETMDTVALNALAEKFGKPGEAFGVNGAFRSGEPKTIAERYSLPEGE